MLDVEAGPDARHSARELAATARPAGQQPQEKQQQQSHRLADERQCVAGPHLAGDLFLGAAKPRLSLLQSKIKNIKRKMQRKSKWKPKYTKGGVARHYLLERTMAPRFVLYSFQLPFGRQIYADGRMVQRTEENTHSPPYGTNYHRRKIGEVLQASITAYK